MVPRALSPFLCLVCWDRTLTFLLGGVSIWRSVFRVCLIWLYVSVLKGWINFLSLPDGLAI